MNDSLSQKLQALRTDLNCGEFILADAKDADMAWGVLSPGRERMGQEAVSRRRSITSFRQTIREIVRQGAIDIMLASTSTMSILAHQERLFEQSHVVPAVRINDSSDIWIVRGGMYRDIPSRPFATSLISEVQFGVASRPDPASAPVVNLGLYSVTFNNQCDDDLRTLKAFRDFRQQAVALGFKYFLEVFPPNISGTVANDAISGFVNDHICRMLAGVPVTARPEFLKVPYFGPAALEELVSYDPSMIVGILGGNGGTTYDAFKLLADAKKYGARVALFGRKIKDAEEPLSFIRMLRAVADDELTPESAVREYRNALEIAGITPQRSLSSDLELTATELLHT